jgi:hypothetical protein
VCPGTRRLLGLGTAFTPGKKAAAYEAIKTTTYNDQHNFVPFIAGPDQQRRTGVLRSNRNAE